MIGAPVHRLDVVDSTQSVLARLAREGAPEGTVVTARHQTAGRGRRGHSWWDEPDSSLLLSILLRPTVAASQVAQLSLVCAVAVSDALTVETGIACRIRWPNDVLAGDRKLSGILPDAACTPDGRVEHVIVGIGINLAQRAFPGELADLATSVRLVTGRAPDRRRIESALLAAIDARYRQWLSSGFAALRAAWLERSGTIGTRVRLPEGGHGVAVDVDADGALLVDGGAGHVTRVLSGPVAAAS